MGISNWFKKRRIKRRSDQFSTLLAQDDPGSINFFELHLSPCYTEIDMALRLAYHLARWSQLYEAKDYDSVVRIAELEDSQGTLTPKALQAMRLQRLQSALARCIRGRSEKSLRTEKGLAALASAGPMERLGAAATTALTSIPAAREDQEIKEIVKKILSSLPERRELKSELLLRVYDQLRLWALWKLEHYEALVQSPDSIKTIPKNISDAILSYAADRWGEAELTRSDIKKALSALQYRFQLGDAKGLNRMQIILSWGLYALNNEALDEAFQWFDYHLKLIDAKSDPLLYLLLSLGMALALLKRNKLSSAQSILEKLSRGTKNASPSITEGFNFTQSDLRFYFDYLHVLCLLKSTSSWPTPNIGQQDGDRNFAGLPDKSVVQEDGRMRPGFHQNRVMWAELREKILQLIGRMVQTGSALVWKAHLVAGFVTFVETSCSPDPNLLADFAAAIDQGESPETLTSLKTIQGVLVARAKATQEAMRLVDNGDKASLLLFKKEVLDPIRETVPPLIRAAVVMTLWENDPTWDPLPELHTLDCGPEERSQIDRCIALVRTLHALRLMSTACRSPKSGTQDIEALKPSFTNDMMATTHALGAALVQLKSGQPEKALAILDDTAETSDPILTSRRQYLDFYAAWHAMDFQRCSGSIEILAPMYFNTTAAPVITMALRVRIMHAELAQGETNETKQWLEELLNASGWDDVLPTVFAFTLWFLGQKSAYAAAIFLDVVYQKSIDKLQEKSEADLMRLTWQIRFGRALCQCLAGQYNRAIEELDWLSTVSIPQDVFFRSKIHTQKVTGWVNLLRIQASLALTAETSENVPARWPTLRRLIEESDLKSISSMSSYAGLIEGAVAFLSPDALVDTTLIQRLEKARQELKVKHKAAFMENIIGKLNWRRRILEDFWTAMSLGKFKDSRAMYRTELFPAYGDHMPSAIQLGMIMADWDSGEFPTTELLKRLVLLEAEAPDLNKVIIRKVKNYILDGDKIRHLTKKIRDSCAGDVDFQETIDFIRQTEWAGMEKGSMPVPVAITLLYSLYRKERNEEARDFGGVIRESRGVVPWVRDYGLLLLGYVLYQRLKDYTEAAAVFGEISKKEILGHKTDDYWSVSHFNQGCRFLENNEHHKAFASFGRAMAKKDKNFGNFELVYLFLHFGMKNMEARKGNRAHQAFTLSEKNLASLKQDAETVKLRFCVRTGLRLCEALQEETSESISGDSFLEIFYESQKAHPQPDKQTLQQLEWMARVLAVCATLRHGVRFKMNPEKRIKPEELTSFLDAQVERIQELTELLRPQSPVLYVLKGMILLRLKKGDHQKKALKEFSLAARLGIHSARLSELIIKLSQSTDEMDEQVRLVMDLFDAYLMAGQVPLVIKDKLIRSDDLAELYRIYRNYRPADLVGPSTRPREKILCERLVSLDSQAEKLEYAGEKNLQPLRQELKKALKTIESAEATLLEIERQILAAIATRMRTQLI